MSSIVAVGPLTTLSCHSLLFEQAQVGVFYTNPWLANRAKHCLMFTQKLNHFQQKHTKTIKLTSTCFNLACFLGVSGGHLHPDMPGVLECRIDHRVSSVDQLQQVPHAPGEVQNGQNGRGFSTETHHILSALTVFLMGMYTKKASWFIFSVG